MRCLEYLDILGMWKILKNGWIDFDIAYAEL